MYFFKESGKQVLDLTGNLILSFNDSLVKARAPSAAPDAVKDAKKIMINELTFIKKIAATFIVLGFIWGKNKALVETNTGLNKPYVKEIPKDYADNVIKCPVTDCECKHYIYQCDNNGEVAIEHCKHPDNKSEFEGNCINELCPLLVKNNGRPDVPPKPPVKPVG